MREETAYWLAISRLPGLTARRARLLRAHFPSGEAAWKASPQDLREVLGVDGERLETLLARRSQLEPRSLLGRVEQAGAWVVSYSEDEYPERLRELFDPPIVIYGWGARINPDGRHLAIVGSRRMTSYGRQVLEEFMPGLASGSLTIISGLARGVDGQAHRSALKHGMLTWAVLGSGFCNIYPREHKQLAMEIIRQGGTLISEYWPDEEPLAYHFPARNRIIAALAEAVLVVEADSQSGSLITVDHALDLGREVLAVPGNITNRFSRGTNSLLKQGAGMALSSQDILSIWGLGSTVRESPPSSLTAQEQQVYEMLDDSGKSVERLMDELDLTTPIILATLTALELKGFAACDVDQRYRRTRRYEAPVTPTE